MHLLKEIQEFVDIDCSAMFVVRHIVSSYDLHIRRHRSNVNARKFHFAIV